MDMPDIENWVITGNVAEYVNLEADTSIEVTLVDKTFKVTCQHHIYTYENVTNAEIPAAVFLRLLADGDVK